MTLHKISYEGICLANLWYSLCKCGQACNSERISDDRTFTIGEVNQLVVLAVDKAPLI